jgi:hypothetical protein
MADRHSITDERLETLLKAHGQVYGDGYRDEPRRYIETAHHPIARSMQFAPGKRSKYKAEREIVGRGGEGRRLIMGAAAGLRVATGPNRGKVIPIPAYMVDPIKCTETRSAAPRYAGRPIPPEMARIEKAVQELEAFSYLRALCVRVQFASDADQKDKVSKVNEILRREVSKKHEGIALRRYRDELLFGRVWLHARLLDDLGLVRFAG